MSDYRKIYEQHYGEIPRDEDGRIYEIHHIDGNHKNDSPENLMAVTIQEHYDIHYSQEDWYACLLIAERMKLSPSEISDLATKNNLKQINAGTHYWLSDIHAEETGKRQRQKVEDRTHHLLGGKIGGEASRQRVKDGTHNLLGPENNRKRIENGTHHLITNNPCKIIIKCPYCPKEGPKPQMKQHHFDNCKLKEYNDKSI